MGKNHYHLEGVYSGTPYMIASKMNQHFWLSKRGSKTGLVINAPVKYAAKFCIMYIFSAVNIGLN